MANKTKIYTEELSLDTQYLYALLRDDEKEQRSLNKVFVGATKKNKKSNKKSTKKVQQPKLF